MLYVPPVMLFEICWSLLLFQASRFIMLRPGTCVQLAAVLLVLACLAISYTVLGTAGASKSSYK